MKAVAINDKFLKASVLAASGVSALMPSLSRAVNESSTCTNSNPVTASNPVQNGAQCAASKSNSNSLFGAGGVFHTVADILIYIVGAVAVIMLIIGGLRYVISQGSKDGVAQAKDTILYAIIGIVVAILAYAIVNFITGSLQSSANNG